MIERTERRYGLEPQRLAADPAYGGRNAAANRPPGAASGDMPKEMGPNGEGSGHPAKVKVGRRR